MRNKRRLVTKLGMCCFMAAMILTTLAGCGYKEAGDFLLERVEGGYAIMDLSKEGYQKKELFIYDQIGRFDILYISKGSTFFRDPPVIDSQLLEKVYFVDYVSCKNEAIFSNCSNLKRIIRQGTEELTGEDLFINSTGQVNQYVKYEVYKKYRDLNVILPANVSFYLNYESEESDGYHWIDDYDYGTKITYIPPEPTREGYRFDGWYKEEACLNAWNFETDTLPEAILDGEGEPIYQETKLFAKWIQE